MKARVLMLSVSIILLSFGANSQTVINIKQSNGFTTKDLREVQSIKFLDGNLKLNILTGEEMSYPLNSVQKIDFGTITSIMDELNQLGPTAVIYPNPSNTNETLSLEFNSALQSPISLSIYSLEGALKDQIILGPNNTSVFTFQLQNIQTGLYIAVIRQGNLVKTEKLIIK